MAINRRIYKQGNSLVCSFPDWMLGELGLKKGDYFKIEMSKSGYLKLSPVVAELRDNNKYSRTGRNKTEIDDELKIP